MEHDRECAWRIAAGRRMHHGITRAVHTLSEEILSGFLLMMTQSSCQSWWCVLPCLDANLSRLSTSVSLTIAIHDMTVEGNTRVGGEHDDRWLSVRVHAHVHRRQRLHLITARSVCVADGPGLDAPCACLWVDADPLTHLSPCLR